MIARGVFSRSARSPRPTFPRFSKRRGGFGPAQIRALSPAAWFRWNVGITVATGVSAWADQSGNGRDLVQATGGAQPAKNADGSILFDGAAHFLKAGAFTLNQPLTGYILLKQVSWTDGDGIWDGNLVNGCELAQRTTTPQIGINAGGAATALNSNLAVGTYGVVAAVFNGASSSVQVNNTTQATGNPGANAMGGFTLGARGDGAAAFSNIEVKEVILFAGVHTADQIRKIVGYLARLGGVSA